MTYPTIREYLLPRALEEERRNLKVRKWSSWMILTGFVILLPVSFIILRWNISTDGIWGILIAVPSSILIAFGVIGRAISSSNSVMPLTEKERRQL